MSNNELHTKDCAINAVDCMADCTCKLTLEGKYGLMYRTVYKISELEDERFATGIGYDGMIDDMVKSVLSDIT